jgi:hypothetical protein
VHKSEYSFRQPPNLTSTRPSAKSKSPIVEDVHHLPSEMSDYSLLNRGNSSSSVITAVRDKSNRSSTDSSQINTQNGRPKLNRMTGSNDAITAAQKALAQSSRSSLKPSESHLGPEDGQVDAGRQAGRSNSTTCTSPAGGKTDRTSASALQTVDTEEKAL